LADAENGLALWCQNQPFWYQQYVCKTLHLPLREVRQANSTTAIGYAEEFLRKLHDENNAACLFLLSDAADLARVYRSIGGDNAALTFNRPCLPEPRVPTYFELFALVNKAARKASGNWTRFREEYAKGFDSFLTGTVIGTKLNRVFNGLVDRETMRWLVARSNCGKKIVIVDTGMQGTFALALAAWFSNKLGLKSDRIDVQLLVTYPWLKELFKGRHITTDAGVLAILEERPTLMADWQSAA
jgi:hypothetical protein